MKYLVLFWQPPFVEDATIVGPFDSEQDAEQWAKGLNDIQERNKAVRFKYVVRPLNPPVFQTID